MEELPVMINDLLADLEPDPGIFYSGCVVAEIRDLRPGGRPATSFGLSRLLVAKQLTWKGIELSHFIPASYLPQAETGLQMTGCACDAPI